MNAPQHFLHRISIFGLLGTASFAFGGLPPDCYDPQNDTHAIKQCQWKALEYYDAQLNRNYHQLKHTLSRKEQSRLRNAQRAWIVWRDKECAFEGYPMRGGSAEQHFVNDCLIRLTRQRAVGLRSLVGE